MDRFDKKKRSAIMARVKSKNTELEFIVRRFLFSKGFRFRLHVDYLPGKPDIVMRKYNLCIFVHGCFWHFHEGCRYTSLPKENADFWKAKLIKNKHRDIKNKMELIALGWRVFEIWGCGLRSYNELSEWLPECVKSNQPTLSWPDYICNDDR
ncbi:very short patch repair endonuclease [Serratia nevei]|uniref:very short patch repair endonuclease n=1 Tax=Serratia nevei TaxID=2703794 RepID=UPI00313EBA37